MGSGAVSRTRKAKPAPGKEFWKSRLYPGGENRGPLTKLWTHRKGRRQGKREALGSDELRRRARELDPGPTLEDCCPDLLRGDEP